MTLTVISFVFWGVGSSRMNNSGGGSTDFGSIYGHKITQQDYVHARNEVYLYNLFNRGEWPRNLSEGELEQQMYGRMMLVEKSKELGIHVGQQAVITAANEMLRSLGRNNQPLPMATFVNEVLPQQGLTSADFERFVRHDLVIQQVAQTFGMAGDLITPQEITAAYTRQHQEFSAQIVFFSASNYLASTVVTPAAVGQFYTNYLAAYRLPDRVQVAFTEFNLTNYLTAATQKLGTTNLNNQVESIYRQYGQNAVPEAKTPEEAKSKIRESVIRQEAMTEARAAANAFAAELFTKDPTNLLALPQLAKQKNLDAHLTAPFNSSYGPEDFNVPAAFTKAAFELTADSPIAGPIAGPTSVYIIALNKQLPSVIPSFEAIRDRVTEDFRHEQAITLAQRAGTNFVQKLNVELASGKTFAVAAVAAGYKPEVLPPFSLATQTLPALEDRIEINQLKQVTYSTGIGKVSGLQPTGDGAFILFVQLQLPVDQTEMTEQLPAFTTSYRRARQNEVFNEWLSLEANRALRDTPVFRRETAAGAAK